MPHLSLRNLNAFFFQGYGRKATALEFMGRYGDAVLVYQEALKIDPGNEQYKEAMANVFKVTNRSWPRIFQIRADILAN